MEHTLDMLKAVSDGNRLRVVIALTHFQELCVCEITDMLGLATATVSRHMSVLQKARLVRSRKNGRWVYYSISEEFPALFLGWLKKTVGNDSKLIRDKENLVGILGRRETELCKPKARGRNSFKTIMNLTGR